MNDVYNRFMEIVSTWDRKDKLKILEEYGSTKHSVFTSNRKLNEKTIEVLIFNLNQADTNKILSM